MISEQTLVFGAIFQYWEKSTENVDQDFRFSLFFTDKNVPSRSGLLAKFEKGSRPFCWILHLFSSLEVYLPWRLWSMNTRSRLYCQLFTIFQNSKSGCDKNDVNDDVDDIDWYKKTFCVIFWLRIFPAGGASISSTSFLWLTETE